MFGFAKRAVLVVALGAFALQVGTAATIRCEMMAAAAAGSGHHHSAPEQPPADHSQHATHCICVAGCQVGLTVLGGLGLALTPARPDGPTPFRTGRPGPIRFATRDHILPPAQAPPGLV